MIKSSTKEGIALATQAMVEIWAELVRAEEIHPNWPIDPIHATAIVAEEAGEALQAALDTFYGGKHAGKTRVELVQCGAMCVRALMHLDEPVKQKADLSFIEALPLNVGDRAIVQTKDGEKMYVLSSKNEWVEENP